MRGNAAFWVLTALGLAAAMGLPLVNVAPNRLVSGEGVSLWQVWQTLAAPEAGTDLAAYWQLGVVINTRFGLLALGLGYLLALVWAGNKHYFARGLLLASACTLIPELLLLCGTYAAQVAVTQSPMARTSLGSAYWVLTLVLWLGVTHSLQQWRTGLVLRSAVWLGLILSLVGLLAWGACDQLSLMKEFANHADTLAGSVWRHLQIVLFTLVPTLGLGLPLGWAIHRSARLQQWLLPPLNIIQTIPSIALFGLLMVPLAWLTSALPWLAHWGVSGIGLAPAVVALTLYSLLPVVRGTQAGLAQVPASVLDAARGMGMHTAQILWWVQLPLAAPVVLAGVRTAAIQTVGLAAVAALIGAGGLGAIMFDGLFGSAQDLVLLGVLPIVGLALLLDLGFKLLAEWLRPATQGGLA
jgi:osmoprotectant transport system permease protein